MKAAYHSVVGPVKWCEGSLSQCCWTSEMQCLCPGEDARAPTDVFVLDQGGVTQCIDTMTFAAEVSIQRYIFIACNKQYSLSDSNRCATRFIPLP